MAGAQENGQRKWDDLVQNIQLDTVNQICYIKHQMEAVIGLKKLQTIPLPSLSATV